MQSKKATFSLPIVVLDEIKEAVRAGLAASSSDLVRDAVRARLRELREEKLRREFEEAARDPLFLRDIAETEEAFRWADSESARRLPE